MKRPFTGVLPPPDGGSENRIGSRIRARPRRKGTVGVTVEADGFPALFNSVKIETRKP